MKILSTMHWKDGELHKWSIPVKHIDSIDEYIKDAEQDLLANGTSNIEVARDDRGMNGVIERKPYFKKGEKVRYTHEIV